jgi:hypothetical protein
MPTLVARRMKLYIRKQSQQIEDGLAFEKVIETLNI